VIPSVLSDTEVTPWPVVRNSRRRGTAIQAGRRRIPSHSTVWSLDHSRCRHVCLRSELS